MLETLVLLCSSWQSAITTTCCLVTSSPVEEDKGTRIYCVFTMYKSFPQVLLHPHTRPLDVIP